jgi:manganese oxidase
MDYITTTNIVLAIWFTLVAVSTAYVAYDQFKNNPEPVVMKWGFILVTLYMGPIALLLYVMADKEPKPGTHEEFIKPLWKQGVGSTIHCVAGDATGIILAAVIVLSLGLPMWVDLLIEYIAGFAFGLFIFQALFMKNMMGGSYWENVRRSFVPEWLSMNAMMAGMAPVMSFLMMGRDMRAMEPTEPMFWFVMSLGVMVGFATCYPVNVWLVSRRLKHGLMTVRKGQENVNQSPQDKGSPAMTINHRAMQQGARSQGTMNHSAMDDSAMNHSTMGHGTNPGNPRNESSQTAQGHEGMSHGQTDEKDRKRNEAHDGHAMQSDVTRPQLAAVALVTTIMLVGGLALPGLFVNLSLSARDVGGVIMPPGMIMTRDTPGEAMRDMSAVLPKYVSYTAPAEAQGDQPLEPRLENGVKVFELNTSVIRWNILDDEQVLAYTFNEQVPGPRIELTLGDQVRFIVTNNLPESTTVHWHGLILPNEMDGPAEITQEPIQPGESYTYEFTVQQTGTYFYHTHDHSDRQQTLGLYGALIIRPQDPADEPQADLEYTIQLQEWLEREGLTYPAMIMEGGLPNYFTINGKAYPDTDTISMRVGQTLKLRFIGSNNNFIHPMHVHGGPFEVVTRDGEILQESARFLADTVNVGPGQRYDVIWTAREPGKWLIHCHIPHHTVNNNVEEEGGGGLMMVIEVAP